MTAEQAKILGLFFVKVAGLAAETLTEFAENEKSSNQVSLSSPPTNPEKRFLNRKQIAERLGVSVRTVSELINEGLPTIPLGRKRIQFDCDEVLSWAKNRRIEERGKTKLRVVS